MFVPVVDLDNKPLMPTSSARARRWVESGKATPFWKQGIWCVRLNREPSARNIQAVAIAVDPGSKREGFTVKSEAYTYLNVQTHAVTWVKDKLETRRNLRRSRRGRKAPCRKPRWANRGKSCRLSPSTKARWQWKLRVIRWLAKVFPINTVIVEDIEATTKKGKRWNLSFSPLQVGKEWFYSEIRGTWKLIKYKGYETAEIRSRLGVKKSSKKLAEDFYAHCVDSWAMATDYLGGPIAPDNLELLIIKPLKFSRRQLHVQNFANGGIRKQYGSTLSLGFVRGSIVTHPKWGAATVGGTSKGRISLHCRKTGKRLCQNVNPEYVRFRCFNSFTAGAADSSTA